MSYRGLTECKNHFIFEGNNANKPFIPSVSFYFSRKQQEAAEEEWSQKEEYTKQTSLSPILHGGVLENC